MTSSESAVSAGMRCRSRRMRRRSCTLTPWAAKRMNCSLKCSVCFGIGWRRVLSARGGASKQGLTCVWSLDDRITSSRWERATLPRNLYSPWTVDNSAVF